MSVRDLSVRQTSGKANVQYGKWGKANVGKANDGMANGGPPLNTLILQHASVAMQCKNDALLSI